MILLPAVWLLQDLLQVLAMGIVMVPEFFLLFVMFAIVSGSLRPERISVLIWLAFAGGVVWDLRWVTYPGMSGLVNVLSVLAIYTVWNRTPLAGRSVLLFGLLSGAAHFLSGVGHYIAWAVPGQAAMRMFLIQQLLGVPVLALLCMIMAFRETEAHV
ncbi:MAG: hypothetical protein LBU26_04925 [Synergistaceae bacterium]|nr:hypothetical protein [Synergistaceae bacterium]